MYVLSCDFSCIRVPINGDGAVCAEVIEAVYIIGTACSVTYKLKLKTQFSIGFQYNIAQLGGSTALDKINALFAVRTKERRMKEAVE